MAVHLAQKHKYRCTFVSEKELRDSAEIQHVQFPTPGGATQLTHYCSRTFENQTWRSHAVFETLEKRKDIRPDLIVAHSGFVSSLFLRELYPDTPQINYFEFFYHTKASDLDFRQDLPLPDTLDLLRARTRNAQLLLDLHNCDAGYVPTEFQRAQIPLEYQYKLHTIFDGIDERFWRPIHKPQRMFGELSIPADTKVVTYVSRGFEAARGFDIFLRAAARICRERTDVMVVVVGEDRIAYGGDDRFTGGKSFKDWTVEKHQIDLTRIHFIGRLPPSQLVQLLSLSDVHIYLTIPFVLSWSLLNAMSCGALLLASDTAPVREVLRDGHNGRLVDFFDVENLARTALHMLANPAAYSSMRSAARETITSRYTVDQCLAQMVKLYDSVVR